MQCAICQAGNAEGEGYCHTCGSPLVPHEAAPNEASLRTGAMLGGGAYVVGRTLGQGGFGITYLASDVRLRRAVTIKEYFPPGCSRRGQEVVTEDGSARRDFEKGRRQFLEEACVLAQFHQPGIVEVHACFEENGTAYTVMEFIPGKTLAEVLRDHGGTVPETVALGYILQIGDALQAVHEAGLLHRDIKPHNVMATNDGRVVLIDFGTARHYVSSGQGDGGVMVTPGYAPLEQYTEQARRGAYSDIYSLAATLYHLLTGQPPASASDRAKGVEVAPIRQFNPDVARHVQEAVMGGLAMAVARRPQTVREFLDQLMRPNPAIGRLPTIPTSLPVGTGAPGNVAKLSPADQAARGQAHKVLVGMGLAVIAIVGIGVMASQNTGMAGGAGDGGVGSTPPVPPPSTSALPPNTGAGASAARPMMTDGGQTILKGHHAEVSALAFSSDGSILASGSYDKTIRWWDVAMREATVTLKPLDSAVRQIAFSSDDHWFAALTADGRLHLYDGIGKPRPAWTHSQPYQSISFVPGQDRLVTTSVDGAEIWDLPTGEREGRFPDVRFNARMSRDLQSLIGVDSDGKLNIWSVSSPGSANLATGGGLDAIVTAAASDRVAVLMTDHSVQDWIVGGGHPYLEGTPSGNAGDHASSLMTLSPNGQELATVTNGGMLSVYWPPNLSQQVTQMPKPHPFGSMAFSPDGRTLAMGDTNNDVQLWRFKPGN